MGVLVTITYPDGEQATVFLTSADLDNYLAAGDVKITYIDTNIPDYVISTLNLVSQSQLTKQLSAADYASLLEQSGNYTPDQITALVAKYGGQITVGQFVDQFVNNQPAPPQPPGFVDYYTLSVIGQPQFVGNKVSITVQAVGTAPDNTSQVQFEIQIIDKNTGRVTNFDYSRMPVSSPVQATFNEIVPTSTKDAIISLYFKDPDNEIQLAEPMTQIEVLQATSTQPKSNMTRDLIIGLALAVGVPAGVVAAYKMHRRKRK